MINGSNTTITTYRLVDSSSTAAFSATATITGAAAYIESIGGAMLAVLGEHPGIEVFNCHVEPGDYREGDKAVDAQSTEYRITGIERHENNEDTDDVYILTLHKKAKHYNG